MIILSRFNLRQFCRDRRLAVLRSLPPFFSPLIRFDQKGYWWAVHHSYISPSSSFLHCRHGHFNISTRRLASFVKILNQEDISKHQNHDTIQEVNTDVRIRNPRNTTKQYGGRGDLCLRKHLCRITLTKCHLRASCLFVGWNIFKTCSNLVQHTTSEQKSRDLLAAKIQLLKLCKARCRESYYLPTCMWQLCREAAGLQSNPRILLLPI